MSFQLANDGRLVNRRWGPREWNGREVNHNGIDQALADGTEVIVDHPGRLAKPARHVLDSGAIGSLSGVGYDATYGFFAMYQVTEQLRVSYHQLRNAGRGASDLTPGETSVGRVGNPLVTVKPPAARAAHSNWSGALVGLSDRSGPHLHTQCWQLIDGVYRAVNPDSAWVAGQLEKAEDDMKLSDEDVKRIAVEAAKQVWDRHQIGKGTQVSPQGRPGDLLSQGFARAGGAANTARGLVGIIKAQDASASPAEIAKELATLIGPRADAKAIVAELGKQLSS